MGATAEYQEPTDEDGYGEAEDGRCDDRQNTGKYH
jgi:hypothetical protein